MKHFTYILCLGLGLLSACMPRTGVSDATGVETDSVGCLVSKQGIEVEISADYPTRDTLMQPLLARYIVSKMLTSVPDSTATEGKALLQSCAEAMWKYLCEQSGSTEEAYEALTEEEKELLPSPDEMMWNSSYTARFRKVFDTEEYVSWQCSWDMYVDGSPHPLAGGGGVTFSKADGHQLGREILTDTDSQGFQQLLTDALRQWVAVAWEEDYTDEQMGEALCPACKLGALPLPRQAPFLTAEGVALPYEEYELTGGRDVVTLILPYDKVEQYLVLGQKADEALDWSSLYWKERDDNRMLGTDIPKGSWWTDGNWFYQVTATGATVRMEGYTLHEGGGVCAFAVSDGEIRTAMPKEGYTTFAEADRLVTHQELTVGKGERNVEVLIAYAKDGHSPVAVLQRLDDGKPIQGDEFDEMMQRALRFQLADIHAVLSGTYRAEATGNAPEREWTFLPDGTVRTTSDGEAKTYGVELVFDTPSDVIRMPDGQRYAVELEKNTLSFYKAIYDDEEECWTKKDDKCLFALSRVGQGSPSWVGTRIFSPAMMTVWDDDMDDLKQWCEAMRKEQHPIPLLNSYLLPCWLEEDD